MSDFLVRFMQSEDARREFPDPRQRLAAAEISSRERRLPDFYELAKQGFTACCAKQDVPEVEAIVALLQGPLEAHWQQTMEDALEAAVQGLRELEDELPTSMIDGLVAPEDRKRNEELLILGFISALEEAARAPLPVSVTSAIAQATESLLNAGARSQGLELDLAREPLARSAARADLRTLVAGRVETRRGELRQQAQEFLRSRRARTPARPGDITDAAEGFRARNLQEWLARNVDLTGLRTSEWLPAVADQWAYRWFVVGQFLSGLQAGLTELRAVAVIDDVTTQFCRWVNGRTIAVDRAAFQLNQHIRASLERDIEALQANWPMLPTAVTRSTDTAALRQAFVRVGLPPYHFRCRTLIQWVRIGL